MIRTIYFFSLFLSTVLYGQGSPDTLSLDVLVKELREKNPQLQALRNQAEAAKTRYGQVTALDAPQVGVEFYQTPIASFPIPTRKSMETDYFVQQMFPWPGKLSAMGKVARNEANAQEEYYRAAEKKIILEVKSAYYELYLVQRKIAINEENQKLLKSLIEIAEKQFEVGMGKQSDVVRAQTELSKLSEQSVELKREKKVIEAMINSLIDQPANNVLGLILDLEAEAPFLTYDELVPLSDSNRHELKSMRYEIEMNKAELAASKREYYPDIMLRGQYKNMSNTAKDFWSLMIGVNIPLAWWSKGKYQGKVQETRLNITKVENQYRDMSNMVRFEIQSSLSRIEADHYRVLLYKNTIIPQAQHSLDLIIAEYQSTKTEFLMVLDAYRMLLMARLDYHMTIMEFMTGLAKIEQSVGLTVDEIKTKINR